VIDAAIDAAKPVIVAITTDNRTDRTGRFRLPQLLAVFVELKARERGAD
jgi:hypothetical protein